LDRETPAVRIIDYFQQGLRRGPERPAFIEDDRVVTWGETAQIVERAAAAEPRRPGLTRRRAQSRWAGRRGFHL
jgi:acyl-CoA synthetase (AMP-forming)/AMP-acid ligase II